MSRTASNTKRTNHTPWYVLQCMAGTEESIKRKVLQAVELVQRLEEQDALLNNKPYNTQAILTDIFVPYMKVGKKDKASGKWVPTEETLLPGYLIAITDDPKRLHHALTRVDNFVRLVTQGDKFATLPSSSITWLEAHTNSGKQAVEMSEGYVEKGVLHITSGPLLGKEALVRKVNHRKKIAYLEIKAFGRTINAQMGIRITRNRT